MKQILIGASALDKITSGANKLCDAVKLTLGPKGKNVAIGHEFGYPLITNDGVTIAKEITLSDAFENIGAESIKEASIKSNDMAGDGTTTACVLATAILNEGAKNIMRGANGVIIKKGISKACDVIVKQLQLISKPIVSSQDIRSVATISAGSTEIGDIITKAFEAVGKDGVITVDGGKTIKTDLRISQGMQFDRGYVSPYMITDNQKMLANLSNPLILVTSEKITNINQIIHILEAISSSGRSLLIIADDYDTEVINTLVVNKLRGNLNVVCVKSPAFADKKDALLMDICTITQTTLITSSTGKTLQNVNIDDLGEATNVVITKDNTTITGGKGKQTDIQSRAKLIKEQIANANSDFDADRLRKRLARLTSGIAIVEVGSTTELEMQEQKLRIEDAIESTKSAVEEGIVPGGGTALITTLPALYTLIDSLSGDERVGAEIVSKAITSPLKNIVSNAGGSGDVVLNKVIELQASNGNMGYDALNDKYVDMFEAGIIDPTKVTRCAVINACSVASTLLTTECIVTIEKDK